MSVEALSWALRQPVQHSSAKFVLVVLADCADKLNGTAWPSMSHLCEATSQDRKTVIANIARLKEAGYIEDSGERKGSTKQVVVYRLKSPENGTVKESRKRNSPKSGTVPETDNNSTVFPAKESRFSVETVPKTGHGTVMEPSMEPSGNQEHGAPDAPRQPRGRRIPDDWSLTDTRNQMAEAAGLSASAASKEAARFVDYWRAAPGAKGVKADWDATWRNWCRRAAESPPVGRGKPSRHDLSGMNYTAGVAEDGRF